MAPVPTIRVVSPRLSAIVLHILESITSILLRESARNLYMVVVEVTPTVSIPRKSAKNDVKIPIPIPILIKTTTWQQMRRHILVLEDARNFASRFTVQFADLMGRRTGTGALLKSANARTPTSPWRARVLAVDEIAEMGECRLHLQACLGSENRDHRVFQDFSSERQSFAFSRGQD